MGRRFFKHETSSKGARLQVLEKPLIGSANAVPVEDWAERMGDEAFSGVSRILALLDDEGSPVVREEDGIFVDHATIASLSAGQSHFKRVLVAGRGRLRPSRLA
jgi:hypothetical protein